MVPRRAGMVTTDVCWVCAACCSDCPRTVASHPARAPASMRRLRNRAKRKPMRRATGAIAYRPFAVAAAPPVVAGGGVAVAVGVAWALGAGVVLVVGVGVLVAV